jgi:hypothetical protein
VKIGTWALLSFAILTGCQTAGKGTIVLAPLREDGEVFLYLERFTGSESDRLEFTIDGVALVRPDGSEAPLQLALTQVSREALRWQRLLAWGRVAPGTFAAVKIRVGRATVAGPEGKSDLLVSKEPLRVDVPVAVERGQARLATLALQGGATGDQGFAFVPRFVAGMPPNTIVALTGYCTSTTTASVAVFDKVRGGVVAMFPTGAEPKGIALDGQGRAYVALSGSDELQVLDLSTGAEVGRVALRPGDRPRDVAITPDGRVVLVTNPGSRTASFVDASALVETSRVSTGEEPVALLMDRAGRRALVFNFWSSNITVIDVASRAVAMVVATDAQPLRGQFDRSGTRLYVINGYSPYLSVLSVPDFATVGRFLIGAGARSIQVDPRTDMVYVGSGDPGVRVFNPVTFVQFGTVKLPGEVSWMTVDPVSNTLYGLMPTVGAVAGVDLTSLVPVSRADVGEGTYAVVVVEGR